MKSIRECLELLPEPYRTQAINNHRKLGENRIFIDDDGSMECAIHRAFIWARTPEGGVYWANIEETFLRIAGRGSVYEPVDPVNPAP